MVLSLFWMAAEEVSRLRQEVAAGAAQIQQMQQDLQAWEDAVTARDAELRNLQVAPLHRPLPFPPCCL